jgi:hypothetical protein
MSEYKLGTVTSTSGGISVQFDGETAPSTKKYKRLASYSSPAVSDRVLLVKAGGTYVILGKII